MGAHHFKLYVVPPGSLPTREADGDFTGDFLLGFDVPKEVVGRLRSLLPQANHFGDIEEFNSSSKWGSDLRIHHEADGRIAEIVMRYAPAGDPIQVLHAFVDAVKDSGCELLVETTGNVIPPEFDRVVAALREHRAFRFLRDPEGAIKEAADETNQKG